MTSHHSDYPPPKLETCVQTAVTIQLAGTIWPLPYVRALYISPQDGPAWAAYPGPQDLVAMHLWASMAWQVGLQGEPAHQWERSGLLQQLLVTMAAKYRAVPGAHTTERDLCGFLLVCQQDNHGARSRVAWAAGRWGDPVVARMDMEAMYPVWGPPEGPIPVLLQGVWHAAWAHLS